MSRDNAWKKPGEEPPHGTPSNIREDEEPYEEPCPCRLFHHRGGTHGAVSRDPRSRSVSSKGFLAIERHPPPSRISYGYSDLEVSRTPTINEPSHHVIGDLGHRRWYCFPHLFVELPLTTKMNSHPQAAVEPDLKSLLPVTVEPPKYAMNHGGRKEFRSLT